MKSICVIDGHGGGIGSTIIKSLKKRYGETIEILALETNAVASSQMLKAGANRAAAGENPVLRMVKNVDIILGPIAITWPNAMMGEITTSMAEAITSCKVPKILITLHQETFFLVGLSSEPLPHLFETMMDQYLKEVMKYV